MVAAVRKKDTVDSVSEKAAKLPHMHVISRMLNGSY